MNEMQLAATLSAVVSTICGCLAVLTHFATSSATAKVTNPNALSRWELLWLLCGRMLGAEVELRPETKEPPPEPKPAARPVEVQDAFMRAIRQQGGCVELDGKWREVRITEPNSHIELSQNERQVLEEAVCAWAWFIERDRYAGAGRQEAERLRKLARKLKSNTPQPTGAYTLRYKRVPEQGHARLLLPDGTVQDLLPLSTECDGREIAGAVFGARPSGASIEWSEWKEAIEAQALSTRKMKAIPLNGARLFTTAGSIVDVFSGAPMNSHRTAGYVFGRELITDPAKTLQQAQWKETVRQTLALDETGAGYSAESRRVARGKVSTSVDLGDGTWKEIPHLSAPTYTYRPYGLTKKDWEAIDKQLKEQIGDRQQVMDHKARRAMAHTFAWLEQEISEDHRYCDEECTMETPCCTLMKLRAGMEDLKKQLHPTAQHTWDKRRNYPHGIRERVLVEEFIKYDESNNVSGMLVSGDQKHDHRVAVTRPEMEAILATIQWLGTNCGSGFLETCHRRIAEHDATERLLKYRERYSDDPGNDFPTLIVDRIIGDWLDVHDEEKKKAARRRLMPMIRRLCVMIVQNPADFALHPAVAEYASWSHQEAAVKEGNRLRSAMQKKKQRLIDQWRAKYCEQCHKQHGRTKLEPKSGFMQCPRCHISYGQPAPETA